MLSLNTTYWLALLVAGVPAGSMNGWFRFHLGDPFILLGPGFFVGGVIAGALPSGRGYTVIAALLGVVATVVWTFMVSACFPESRWIQEGLMWFCSPLWLPPSAIVVVLVVTLRRALGFEPPSPT